MLLRTVVATPTGKRERLFAKAIESSGCHSNRNDIILNHVLVSA